MKRIGFLYGKLCSKDNIREAIIRSSKGKRNRKEVIKIINNIEYYVEEIEKLLVNKTYNPKNYQVHIIYDKMNKKNREIYKPAYYPYYIIIYLRENNALLNPDTSVYQFLSLVIDVVSFKPSITEHRQQGYI